MTQTEDGRLELAIPLIGLVLVLGAAHVIFGGFFPGPNGLGHDYAGGFPAMLAEYYWSRSEGVFAAPWFTPAFCGGIPLFADPGSMFYAFPSLFVRALGLDPLSASYLTFLLFVGLGFTGTYVFCRCSLGVSLPAAAVAATLFALNGFFTHRFMVGHIGFHGIMLSPWLAYCVKPTARKFALKDTATLVSVACGGLILAYWVHSGAQSLIVAFGLSAAALCLLAWTRGVDFRDSLLRAAAITTLGLALAASKLVAALSFMAQFPRNDYRLPGFTSIFDTLVVVLLTLFGNLTDIADMAAAKLENTQWSLDRHELEFGLTAVPLILMLLAIGVKLAREENATSAVAPDAQRRMKQFLRAMLVILLSLPILLNTYSPAWNEVLKTIPLVGSSSSLVRWFVIYVPFMAVISGILIDSISARPDGRRNLAIGSIALFLALTASVDRSFYTAQNYSPTPIVEAFRYARNNPAFRPSIQAIGAFVDDKRNVIMPLNRNDLVAVSASQLACYMPIFGYRLESFPFGNLHVGSVFDEANGFLNVKNPACFVFPEANFCAAGDHFSVSRRRDAENFLSYRAFPFEKSSRQKIADITSAIALIASALALLGGLALAVSAKRRPTT